MNILQEHIRLWWIGLVVSVICAARFILIHDARSDEYSIHHSKYGAGAANPNALSRESTKEMTRNRRSKPPTTSICKTTVDANQQSESYKSMSYSKRTVSITKPSKNHSSLQNYSITCRIISTTHYIVENVKAKKDMFLRVLLN